MGSEFDKYHADEAGPFLMRTLLICHHDAPADRDALARWLASFSTLVGVVVITETSDIVKRRIKRELKRSGPLRFLDILLFRLYYRLFLATRDQTVLAARIDALTARFPPHRAPELNTAVINRPEVAAFIRDAKPDLVIARCKQLLRRDIYAVPALGTFVMHPGICPEYRNAHGCFWALARRDMAHVGMTLLKIDDGVDTGPIYGYYSYPFDERRETHVVIQARTVLDNLDALAGKLSDIASNVVRPIDVAGRRSAVWGQPWLSAYIVWKFKAWRAKP